MHLYIKNEKKKLQFYYQLLALPRNTLALTILFYIKVVCNVSLKQTWCVAVITSGNNTMLLEIS